MRLIDATTLKAEFTGTFQDTYPPAHIKAIIDNAPTVDPFKHGHWYKKGKFLGVFCTACGLYADNTFDYCPNCGCRMDEEVSE